MHYSHGTEAEAARDDHEQPASASLPGPQAHRLSAKAKKVVGGTARHSASSPGSQEEEAALDSGAVLLKHEGYAETG